MMTVHEVSELSGVSIRTLHHYDSIGLLKPSELTGAGYRLYDERAMCRLQTILMFREIGFTLSDIKKILDNPDFDIKTALGQHIEMLLLQKKHIEDLIEQANKMMKGKNTDFSAFDKSNMKKYEKEVKERWGCTSEYAESNERASKRTKDENDLVTNGLMDQFVKIGKIRDVPFDSEESMNAVKELQNYISNNFYCCTKEILFGLGQMYIADERFRENIDKSGGKGTAEYISKAIEYYCSQN